MKRFIIYTILLSLYISCSKGKDSSIKESKKWIAIHLLDYTTNEKLEQLGKQLPELASKGLNTLFLEVDYHFDFKSHPELKNKNAYITKIAARKFKALCDQNGIRLIPQFQSLGHQSWAGQTFELLTVYPELDLTPNAFPNNKDIYCREWDPYNPKVNKIVFALIDEILDAFNADGLHLGMDEVFLITSTYATSTKDKNPADVYAKVVNDFHDYFTKEKQIDLFIWGDRLIDGTKFKHGEWESSLNGTAKAIDMIPKDIVICDWHYEPSDKYLTIPMFIEKGFRVLPTSWRKENGVEKLIKYSYKLNDPKMLGHLFSTWSFLDSVTTYKPLVFGTNLIKSGKFYDVNFKTTFTNKKDAMHVKLSVDNDALTIFYTIDGSQPTTQSILYKTPVKINKTTTIKAVAYQQTERMGSENSQTFQFHKGLRSKVSVVSEITSKYDATNGANSLNDGVLGSTGFNDGKWLGFEHVDFEAVFKFDEPESIKNILFRSIEQRGSQILPPIKIEIYNSLDGINYSKITEQKVELNKTRVHQLSISFKEQKIKYLKIKALNRNVLINEEGLITKSWIFVDEIILN